MVMEKYGEIRDDLTPVEPAEAGVKQTADGQYDHPQTRAAQAVERPCCRGGRCARRPGTDATPPTGGRR